MKPLRQIAEEYVDNKDITVWNVAKSTFKKWMWGNILTVGLVTGLTLFGGKQCYNDYQAAQEKAGDYTASVVRSIERGNISKKDGDKYLSQLEEANKDATDKIIKGLLSLSPSQVLEGMKLYRNSDEIQAEIDAVEKESREKVDKNTKARSDLETALDVYSKSCSPQDNLDYQVALKEFEETGLDPKSYTNEYGQFKADCDERAYYASLRKEVLEGAKKRKAQGMTADENAIETVYDLCDMIEANGGAHQAILEKNITDLNNAIKSELGYTVDVGSCIRNKQQ